MPRADKDRGEGALSANTRILARLFRRSLVDSSVQDEIARLIERADIEPVDMLLAASSVGLISARQPPDELADAQARKRHLLQHLERRDYRVRLASVEDRAELKELEKLCWSKPLRTPKSVLRKRIERYPQGQLVLTIDDAVVGVIYSQLLPNVRALEGATAASVDTRHDPAGRTAQLLAVNILPQRQQQNLGDRLLEFMLIYRSLQTKIDSVVAVTLCRNFDRSRGLAFADYIQHRTSHGALADPILRFHELHGATVERALPGYRPADKRNEGNGVLVSYDIRRRRRRDLRPDELSATAAGLTSSELREAVRQVVSDCLGDERKGAFFFDRPLMEMGLDSADLLQLNEELTRLCRVSLGATFFFQHNTAEKIVNALAERLGPPKARQAQSALKRSVRVVRTEDVREHDIAVIGLSCRLPGGIDSPEQFWAALETGTSAIGALPAGRWTWPEGIDPAGRHKGIDRGGFLRDVATFDAPFFRISPAEAESMDPQQRILLELCWQAIEQAGYAPETLAGGTTGVFVGASGSDYARLLDQSGLPPEAHYGTGSSMAVLANRISYFFDFNGPSLLIDTACSSSLVALHKAVQSLRVGESQQALVGGINLILHPANSIAYHKAGMLAEDGLCKTFDRRANGYVRSEGAVVLLLKPLRQALEAGDKVHAVIKGTACNHGGLASGLTVPKPGQQAALLRMAWRDAAIDFGELGYIEAHGTGTSLGDPIEVEGIREALGEADQSCGLGSVKTNLGHLEAAAGLAGLLKTILCLQHGQLPPSLHFQQLNEHIDLAANLFVVDRLQPWNGPRLAGVSSFGSGGTNAHAVVADAPSDNAVVRQEAREPVLFVLSAKTSPQLKAYARKYAEWLATDAGRAVPLDETARQLQLGRTAMEERLAFVVEDRQALIRRLEEFCADQTASTFNAKSVPGPLGDVLHGEAGRAFIASLVASRDLDKIASLWLSGVKVDWSLLHTAPFRRLALPTYPFAAHSYWLPGTEAPLAPIEAYVAPTLLVPVWRPVAGRGDASPARNASVLIVGGNAEQQASLRSSFANVQMIDSMVGPIDHVFWIAPRTESLLSLFRLVKAFAADKRPLGWTLITSASQAVFDGDALDPAPAGVHGFAGALAKEFPHWSVRAVDLESEQDWPLSEILALPADRDGEVAAHRSGRWHRRFLGPVGMLPDASPVYRQNGVYIVIGGAGALGEAWTRHVVEHCQARVIWIGRRPIDTAIQAKLDALEPKPIYLPADASNLASLTAAYASIKQRWPEIHGVVHSATGVFDLGLAEMDEQRFREVLSTKVEASANIAEVFAAEPLDFLLFFSSVVALEKDGGLSGYAAGGAFQDAFAQHLSRTGRAPAKVINWGHWEIGTGAAIAEAKKTRLRQSGYVPIQPTEAMRALETLLASPLSQAALVKTSRLDALPLVDAGRTLLVDGEGVPSCFDQVPTFDGRETEALKTSSLFNNAALEAALLPLLAASLQSIGAEGRAGVSGFHPRWLEASTRLLAERGLTISGDLAVAWQAWEQIKRQGLANADVNAAIELVEACLKALPDILAGRLLATDVLFPGSSMRRVEGIYRGNAVADHFNGLLGDALVGAIDARLRSDPDARIRILEVGAGTGSTTAVVLPKLARYQRNIAEYAYTDVSKAFLFQAEEQFVGRYPHVKPRLFDVEMPLAGQGAETQHYDFVIATNVLHATRDIRRTLSNCKAALARNGLLLLNEIANTSLFAHLTFGLLEGWWLSEDQALRLPDAPGLSAEGWAKVLRQEGFKPVFPSPQAHVLGQQVIVAESDGVVWQDIAAKPVAKPAPTVAASATDDTSKAAINELLRGLVARTLRMEAGEIDVREPLETYGIDSILIVQIVDALREIFPDVRSTLLFEYQTIDALADHFVRSKANLSVATPATKRLDRPTASEDAIAVIGMSCRFPGADNVHQFWELLKSGQSRIKEIPADRWPLEGFYHRDPDEAVQRGKSYGKWGGFLKDVTAFDPLFFNISPKDAAAIDPQERLFLQTAWESLEDAGYTRQRLMQQFDRRLGVFVGITRTGFDLFGPPLWQRGDTTYPHTSFSSVANRLSYFLDARGPSVPVDTMCSSSLTAIHQACQSLRSGECRLAIAGGVNVYLHPSGYVGLSASRMLSKDGMCRSFGKGGDGFVPGEGVAAVLLKPLSKAVADKDRIYAVIRSTHVNHGGKTNGFTVPNPQAQAELVRAALEKAGINARSVSYIEAHGTGTELGDPIEVTGLTQAFQHFTRDTGFCALGSVKSNIGHLEAAAGIAGFIKAVLQMRHRTLVPSLHAEELNPGIEFARTPFVVQRTLANWQPTSGTRIAGVSSFGAGGANAHVVLEEYPEASTAAESPRDCMIVLSARSEERLKAQAVRLRDFVRQHRPSLVDLAYTLQVGREQMDQRLAFVASSLDDLERQLTDGTGHVGNARQNRTEIRTIAEDPPIPGKLRAWFAQGDYAPLLDLWAKGLVVDWEDLNRCAEQDAQRIGLPTYPFETTRYWLPVVEEQAKPVEVAKPLGIKLQTPAAVPTAFNTQTAVQKRTLQPLESFGAKAEQEPVLEVYDLGDGIYSLKAAAASAGADGALASCIEWVNTSAPDAQPKVLVLDGVTSTAGTIPDCVVPIVGLAAGDVVVATEGDVLEVARNIARASATALTELKKQLSLAGLPAVSGDRWDAGFAGVRPRAAVAPRRIELRSHVVTLEAHDNGVVVVTLHDRAAKNTSSPELVQGVIEAFEHIASTPSYKAVVLTGYDHYFACGGTKEGLLAIQSGKSRFTDEQSYALPLACEIPVIAAMQGHAIGAGWAMGLFCDWTIYGEESVCQSPYMLYGFTPGAGSTLIFPHRLGRTLGQEVLFSAREFQGRELKWRGVESVMPRSEVLPYALALADHLALSSRQELVQRKKRLSRSLRERLPIVFSQELALHDKTFVGNEEVIANVERYFNTSDAAAEVGAAVKTGTSMPDGQSQQQVLETLQQSLADELLMRRDQVDLDSAFTDIGMDSISAVMWVKKINSRFGLSLTATKVYHYPTLRQFADFLLSQLGGASTENAAEVAPISVKEPVLLRTFPFVVAKPAPIVEPKPASRSIAIVGMSGQFPKAATVRQFWENIAQGRDCISEIPAARWSIDAYYDPDRSAPGKTVCRRMGVLEDVDLFDPLFFNISPSEAELMDPQHRLFLENSWRCIEDAGYDPKALSGSLCGVFVGCAASDYSQLLADTTVSAQGLIGESVSMLPARIAYFLNLQGPCLAIDTACSASLVAIASACDSLLLGNSDVALAGGVYVINGPDIQVKMSSAGMLSPDGTCFTFDQRANGFVPGEGVGVLLLKRLEDAERDGDDIHAVIRGWGVNQDGKSNGITAPNQDSQTRLETGVYRKFAIDPGQIQLIEAHGTGTKLGDPIEVDALCDTFRQFTDRRQFCALGSVKTNIGHLATAAGVAGVIKATLALQHGQLPPTINYSTLNEHIRLGDSPFYVNTEYRPWLADAGRKRTVAVSSFGFSGTNAHLVLEEPAARDVVAGADARAHLLPLSAKSETQLRAYAQAVADHLAVERVSLADLAFSYQVGRTAMSYRLAVVATTVDEMRKRLADYAVTGVAGGNCWAGEAAEKRAKRVSIEGVPLAEIAARWAAGEAIDWSSLARPGARRRHGLPTYPFERERYWVPAAEVETPSTDASTWRASDLDAEIDWQGQLRHRLGQRLLVVHADETKRKAFAALLAQLASACDWSGTPAVDYCRPEDLERTRHDCLIALDVDPASILKVAGDGQTIVLATQADTARAEQLGRSVADAIGARAVWLLISQATEVDQTVPLQRLFQEWLAFDATALKEVHYRGAQRFVRIDRVGRRVDPIYCIEKEWRLKPLEVLASPPERGTAVVLANTESALIANKLLQEGDFERIVVVTDASFGDAPSGNAIAQLLLANLGSITHIVDLADLYDAPVEEDGDPSGRVALYQAIVGAGDDVSIIYVTKGLQAFRSHRTTLAGAKFAGLVKMLSADYRQVNARFIDVDQAVFDEPSRLRDIVLQEFDAVPQETELCYREGHRFAPVLTAVDAAGGGAFEADPQAVYVVSGGTNGVGLELAKHLAAKGCRKLVLMGITELPPKEKWAETVERRGLPPYVANKLRELIALDGAVDHLGIYTGPLAAQAALRSYFMKVRATVGPIRGVIHSAAVYSDAELPGFATKNIEHMRRVWDAKVGGLESLHSVFKADPLDFFVALASMTGLVPRLARGAADYAMANTFVEFFVAHRRGTSGGNRFRAIVWSDWNRTGGITRVDPAKAATVIDTFDRLGLRTFSNAEGCALFDRAMAHKTEGTVVIGYLDRPRFERVKPQLLFAQPEAGETQRLSVPVRLTPPLKALPRSILHHLEQWEAEKRAGGKVTTRQILDVISLEEIRRIDAAQIHRLHKLMFDSEPAKEVTVVERIDYAGIITSIVREVLKLKSVDPTKAFQDYGLDSISATVLATRLEKKLKRELQPKWLIEFPTVEALAEYLSSEDDRIAPRRAAPANPAE